MEGGGTPGFGPQIGQNTEQLATELSFEVNFLAWTPLNPLQSILM